MLLPWRKQLPLKKLFRPRKLVRLLPRKNQPSHQEDKPVRILFGLNFPRFHFHMKSLMFICTSSKACLDVFCCIEDTFLCGCMELRSADKSKHETSFESQKRSIKRNSSSIPTKKSTKPNFQPTQLVNHILLPQSVYQRQYKNSYKCLH